MDIEPFVLRIILIGEGLKVKVVRDGLLDIGYFKSRNVNCKHQTAKTETKTIDLEEKARGKELEVNAPRKVVAEVEDKEKQLSPTLKKKKQSETDAARTKFKVDMEKKQ
jgi:hypothetical protein|tara:strand:- start:494 stop:820 length:327 start_codon:yes stop_codon:yes gene_type:complete